MLEFVSNNLALVAIFVLSGLMLVWPEVSGLMGFGGAQVGTLEAIRLMNQGGTLVLDVRDAGEFAEGHLPKARNIPVRELSKRVEELAKFKSKPVIVTCAGGPRAAAAARLLRQSGFTHVYQLKGGLKSWQQASLPVEK